MKNQNKELRQARKDRSRVDCLKKELDGAPNQGVAANEELSHSDAALKKCMQQLNSFREEHEQKSTRCCHGNNK
ncbi:hypothetical protein NC652_023611 [Populus alba x Populus x berolinensis]|nr:hypothetical protein NC652_023611 [Populus alba x Populus x berolinensis]